MGDPEGSDGVSTFLRRFKYTLNIGYAVLGSLEGIPSSLPHQKERGVLMCV